MLTPADFTKTSSPDPGTSSRVILVSSEGLISDFGDIRLMIGGAASGVAGDGSSGVSIGE